MSTRERSIAAVCAIASAIALTVVVAQSGFLLTNDGPAQLFNSVTAAQIDDPRFAPFLLSHPNVTGRGVPEIVALALPSLGWRGAHQLVVVLIALVTAMSVFALVVAVDRRAWAIGIGAATALALQHAFYLGLWHYQLGTGLGLFAIGWWTHVHRRGRTISVVDEVILALLLYGAAAAHAFAAVFAGLACFVVSLAADTRRRPRAILGVVVAGVPAAIVAFLARDTQAGADDPDVWPSLVERMRLVIGVVPGPAWRGGILWLAALVACGGVVLSKNDAMRAPSPPASTPTSTSSLPRSERRTRTALALVAVVLFLLAAIGPRDVLGWQLFGIRPLPFAAALALACMPVRWATKPVGALALAYAAATLAWAAAFHARLDDAFTPLVARIEALDVTPTSPAARGTISVNPPAPDEERVPLWSPYRRVGSLACIEVGGVVWGFYGRAADPVMLRGTVGGGPTQGLVDAIPPMPGAARDAYVRRLAALYVPLGALFASGTPRDLDVIEAAGWQREQRIDPSSAETARAGDAALGVLAARFQGCAARVQSSVGGTVRVGFMPMADATISADVVAGEDLLAGLGCGPMWFRFPAACANADASGRVYATLVRDTATDVSCAPRAESQHE